MTRAEHKAAMNEWVAAVKNKQVIRVPKAGVLRGIGSTVLQIAGYAPMPSEVIDAFTGATSQAYIDMYTADIKKAENAINASNDALVALEAERDSITPVSSKSKSVSMRGDDSRERQKRISTLEARIDALYKKRDALMDALGWLHGKLDEKTEKRTKEEYGEMLNQRKYIPIHRPVY